MMPKRKRDSDDGDTSTRPILGAKQQRIQHKLTQSAKKLAHAFKVAKGFERQKLSRRHKTARQQSNAADEARIDAEIAALKALNNSLSAQHFLYKSLNKVKAISSSKLLAQLMPAAATLPSEPAAQNVHARLCNSAPVKAAFSGVVDEILQAAGHLSSKQSSEEQVGEKVRPNVIQRLDNERKIKATKLQDIVSMNEVSDDALQELEARLASSEDEHDDEVEQLDEVARLEQQLEGEGIRRDSFSDSESAISLSDDDVSESMSARKSASRRLESRMPVSSTVIPSLTMGGYVSGSDASDIDDVDVAPKKNRPGQRARQAIWEKKYGSGAKHLQAGNKNAVWDAKKGATDRHRPSGNRRSHASESRARHGVHTASHHQTASKPKRDDSGPIHPSWEAAKRAKEKAQQMPSFSGKKISFD